MKSLKLKDNITWVGALDPNLRVFDIIMETEFGTTYNSYMVKGNDKIALFETVKVKYFDNYIEKLRSLVDITKIEYIVVDHTEPDHVGSVEKMLEINPAIKMVGSRSAIKFLKGIVNKEFQSIVVNTGDTIDLGGKTLEFIMAPFLHWPDSMYTYIKEDKTLITCDSFGAHYSFDEILLSKVTKRDDYMSALRYYFNMIMGPFKGHVLSAISKIENLEIDMILPGHGPVLDKNPWEIVNIYREWATEETIFNKKTVVIPYVSAYGYTETIAKAIEEGIKSEDNIDVLIHDMVTADKAMVLEQIRWADGLLFGTPTINGDALPPIWDLVMSMSPIVHGKKLAAAFGSYGWSGEGVPNIESRFKMLRLKKFEDGLKINFKPSEEEIETAFNYGKNFAKTILGTIEKDLTQPKSVNTMHPIAEGDGEIKKWICIVCGDVFDGEVAPEMCPTCGAGKDQFEEFIDETNIYTSKEEMKIVIVGNGIAGLSAAKAARKRNANAYILLMSSEKTITYNRPMLSDVLSEEYEKDQFYIEDIEWYEDNKIHLLLNTTVTSLNTNDKTISTENNEKIQYDKLILTTGSHNFIPPITDINKEGVYTIKDLDDIKNIKKSIKDVNKIAIIGGGVLGLEAADALITLGKKVSVIESADYIVKRQLDSHSARYLRSRIEENDVYVAENAGITALLGGDHVTGIQLDTGEVVEAELVIVSTGIRANKDICKGTDIACNNGVLVNSKMETNIKDVYAAGDVAEFDSRLYGIWPASKEQGEIAGANAIGDSKEFSHFTPSVVFNVFGADIFSIGDICAVKGQNHSTLIFDDLKNGNYEKIVFKDDVLVGGILVGNMSKTAKLINGIKKDATKDEVISEIFK